MWDIMLSIADRLACGLALIVLPIVGAIKITSCIGARSTNRVSSCVKSKRFLRQL
jgi:hypothetical protein